MLKCNEENGVEGHLSLECIGGEGYSHQIHKKKKKYEIWCSMLGKQNICDEPRLLILRLTRSAYLVYYCFLIEKYVLTIEKSISMKVESMRINVIYELCPWQINHEA